MRLGVAVRFVALTGLLASPAVAGTSLVVDWTPGGVAAASSPVSLGPVGGMLLLEVEVDQTTRDSYLAVTDGTPAGSREVRGCDGGCRLWNPARVGQLEVNGRAVVVAHRDPGSLDTGADLWAVEPELAQARLLRAGVSAGWSEGPTDASRALLVVGADTAELVETDGTAGGTRSLMGVPALAGMTSPQILGAAGNGEVWFSGRRDNAWVLFAYDLTTSQVREIGDFAVRPTALWRVAAGRWVWFATNVTSVHELWASDGTAAGSLRLVDLDEVGIRSLAPTSAVEGEAGIALAFSRNGGDTEFLVTDGTVANTWWAAPGRLDAWRGGWFEGEHLVASGSDTQFGRELRRVDRAGGFVTLDLCPGPCSSDATLFPWYPRAAELGGKRLVKGVGGDGRPRVWATNGLATGTVDRGPIAPAGWVTTWTALVDTDYAFYVATDYQSRSRLMRYDVTTATATTVVELPTSLALGDGGVFDPLEGRLVVSLDREPFGSELWVSDGTPAGTQLLADFAPGVVGESSGAWDLGRSQAGRLVVGTQNGESGVWRVEGPNAAALVRASPYTIPLGCNGTWCFVGDNQELLGTDGTAAGTRGFGELRGGWTLFEDALIWAGPDGLWRTEGPSASTARLLQGSDFAITFEGPSVLGDLVFTSRTASTEELWRTDGTAAGTLRVADGNFANPRVLWGNEFVAFNWAEGRLDAWSLSSGARRLLWQGTTTKSLLDVVELPLGLLLLESEWDGAATSYWMLLLSADGSVADRFEVPRVEPNGHSRLVAGGGRAYFTVALAEQPWEMLWASDGIPAGTGPVGGVPAGIEALEGQPTGVLAGDHRSLWWLNDGEPRLIAAFDGRSELARPDPTSLSVRAARDGSGLEVWDLAEPGSGVRPLAPTDLEVNTGPSLGLTGPFSFPNARVELSWVDRSGNEEGYLIERRLAGEADWSIVAVVPPNRTTTDLAAVLDVPSSWRVVAANAAGRSAPSNIVGSWSATGPVAGSCTPNAETLCLGDGRYAVRAAWRKPDGSTGAGHAITFGSGETTGLFWFFDEANVELVVKMLDGALLNDHDWVFAGALSDVEYWISVVDTVSGAARSYHNPAGNLCGFADVAAFWKSSAAGPVSSAALGDGGALGLLGGRYQLEVDWRTPDGRTGVGTPIVAGDQSGYFWFFNPANVELVVKMLDGTPVNGHAWLYHGALSDVEYTIRARDTSTGVERTWFNPQGYLCGGADVTAFPQ